MLRPRGIVCINSIALMVLGAGGTSGQDYPSKAVRIVTSPAGGGNDFIARILAEKLSGPLGQPVVVDNRPTLITAEIVSKAPPDGYTLLLAGSTVMQGPLLRKVPYDPVKDFAPISIVDISPNVLVVHPSLPVKSVKELIALAKAKPGALNYASSGAGGTLHLAAELFKSMAGVNILRINYKGSGQAMTSVLSGETQLAFGTAAAAAPHAKSGKVTAVAITSLKPSALVPGLPTVAESGLPGYEVITLDSFLAPAGTPAAIITRLNQELARVLDQADVKEKFLGAGSEAAPSSPEELGARLKSDLAKWGKVIKDAGITAE